MNRLLTNTLMLLTLSAGAATLANAQSADPGQSAPPQQGQYQGHRAPDPNHQTKHLVKQLGLTPDQATQVEPILAARDQQMQALHQNPPADPKAMHHQMRAIQQDTDAKLNAIFNDQQKQSYAQLEADRRHHGHHGQPDGTQQPAPAPQPSV